MERLSLSRDDVAQSQVDEVLRSLREAQRKNQVLALENSLAVEQLAHLRLAVEKPHLLIVLSVAVW